MYILFLVCARLQTHSLADKELFLKSCFRIWCEGISLSYKKNQTFSHSMQSCEKLTTSFLLPEVLSGIKRQMLLVRRTCLTDDRQVSISINAEVDVPEGQTGQLRETACQTLQASVSILNVKVNVSGWRKTCSEWLPRENLFCLKRSAVLHLKKTLLEQHPLDRRN